MCRDARAFDSAREAATECIHYIRRTTAVVYHSPPAGKIKILVLYSSNIGYSGTFISKHNNKNLVLAWRLLYPLTVPGQEKYYNRLDMDPNTSFARYNSIQQ